jgi:hypothetical protein
MGKRQARPPSKRFEKNVKEIVREELKDELEEKQAIVQYDNIPIVREIPSGLVFNGQGNFFQMLPPINQSTTGEAGRAYGERIGNEISLKHIKLRYFLNYSTSDALEIRQQDHKIAVRVMILKCKQYNDSYKAFDDMPTDKLLRYGNDTGQSGVANYNADPLDSFSDINRDLFTVRYDKVHTLTAPVNISGTTSVDLMAPPSGLKFGSHKMTFGAQGLKLKFTDGEASVANNFPYFIAVGCSSLSDANKPASGLAEMTLNCSASYTDA